MKHQHWADTYAEKIIRERSEKAYTHQGYTCASGITPSGTVHIGNFREIISVELVVRALKDKGEPVRFMYSWDDFDVFRKVPENIPNDISQKDAFNQYLRMPITDIPDPWDRADSYALGNEQAIENILAVFGIYPEYIYQADAYKKGDYAEGIQSALKHRTRIIAILNAYRNTPLADDWWPVSVFSSFTKKDTTHIIKWDGAWALTYYCEESKQEETIDIRESGLVKLLWRIDWPMRWAYEKVVFEPAGKDHHSQGGSFDTARDIVKEVYDFEPPITFQYGFVSIKGGSGKISSSSGEVVSVEDVLAVYQPEIIRYLFASTRPNAEFAISFDLDVIKIYEDYDRCERIYFEKEEVSEQRKMKEKRIYELSQTHTIPTTMPLQITLRHLCTVLQIHAKNIEVVYRVLSNEYGKEVVETHKDRLLNRLQCALYWIETFAPEEFKFSLKDTEELPHSIETETSDEKKAIIHLREHIFISWESMTDKDINAKIYDAARYAEIEPQAFFTTLYRRILGKEKGPRLGSFLKILGADVVQTYLQ